MARAAVRETGDSRRSRRVMLAAVVLAVVVAGGAYGVKSATLLPIERLRITGAFDHVDAETLRVKVAPFAREGLLGMDVDAARRAVETLPWVRRAGLRRLWPDTVEMEVVEQRPFARWGDEALVNEEGALFRPAAASWPEGLPALQGPEGAADAVARRYRELQRLLAPLGLRITGASIDDRRSWRLQLAGGTELMLGREHHLERLARFAAVYRPELEQRAANIARVDLRYTNGFAVRWAQPEK